MVEFRRVVATRVDDMMHDVVVVDTLKWKGGWTAYFNGYLIVGAARPKITEPT